MSTPAQQLGAEGYDEARAEGLDLLRDAIIFVQGNNVRYEGSPRIRIKRLEVNVEYEFEGLSLKNYAVFCDDAQREN